MRIVLILILVVVVLVVAVVVSARRSLDHDFSYSRAAAALPRFTPDGPDGIVAIPARGMQFRARVAGLSNTGPGLILLHGFPETSWMWEPLLADASQAGFRVVAFDQRGYSPGARPLEVEAYAMDELLGDVEAVADAVGFERFHLIGHDWGSILGWNFSGQHPDRVISWASLSIAHPGAILDASEGKGPPTYIKVFRMPGLMEHVFGFGDRLLMRKGLYRPIPTEDLEEYLALFSEPGALTAGLNWYRAQTFSAQIDPIDAAGPVSTPTLWIYGSRDMKVFTGPDVRERMREFVTGPYSVQELDAGHWLIQERPQAVVDALLDHLSAHRPDQGVERLTGVSNVPNSQS